MRGLRACRFWRYPCFLHGGHDTLRQAAACFRSKEIHDAIVKRDGQDYANKRSRRHRLGFHVG